MTGQDLFSQQQANITASNRLVGGFVLFLMWLGFGGDIIWYLASAESAADKNIAGLPPGSVHLVPWAGIGITLAAVALVVWASFKGSGAILKASGAYRVDQALNEDEIRITNAVSEMAIAASIPMPAVWIIPEQAPNALATGVWEGEGNIAVTQGLINICSRDELQAVVAHEMGHIANMDTRLMTYLTTLTGFVAFLNAGARAGIRGRAGRTGRARPPAGLAGVLLVVWVISWILAPLVTRYVTMRVSRTREFLADAMSAQYTRNPAALASALEKIRGSDRVDIAIPEAAGHLCISDPRASRWNDERGGMADMMASHPPTLERIDRLRKMAYIRNESGEIDVSGPRESE